MSAVTFDLYERSLAKPAGPDNPAGGRVRVVSFDPSHGALAGAVTAPFGSCLEELGGCVVLKVKTGQREYLSLDPDKALKAARGGFHGLSFTPPKGA